MPRRLRVFISSPSDVADERLRADLVIDKIAQDYGRFFAIGAYRWEHEPMLASGHFQDAIEPPSAFDIVILILWSRLGSPLPERTREREYRGIDGRIPVTGTEWEYEEALKVAREKGAPDLLAFRNVSPARIDPHTPDVSQLNALNAFWRRHFEDRGVFLAAYDEYRTIEEFGRRLEESLRKLIERRAKALVGADIDSPIWLSEPFRGLESYEFEHARIFFGRDAQVTKSIEQLATNARAGRAFLLISGASGSGKSSLVKAGVVPRLTKPQRISGSAFLRRCIFRPSSGGSDVFLGLAKALTTSTAADVGLAELISAGQDPVQLARHLRGAASEPGYIFGNALGRLTESARASKQILEFEEAKLILVVDQLEELFTLPGVDLRDRHLFIQLLAGLARSGVVWVVVTVRADFWHRVAEIPELIALSESRGRLDLPAASPAELSEVIRKPAQAAGLSFETHPATGIDLDAVLAEHAAAAPGALPLLSFTLDELYKEAKKSGTALLTHENYERLGGLEGAIAKRADEIVDGLPASAQATLPRVLRALTTVSGIGDQAPVARSISLSTFSEGSPARMLVEAFIDARLLVAASDGGTTATVRLAHEALISRWKRARDQLAIDRRDLETRTLVERQLERWNQTKGSARRLLLLRNPDLANAADLARRWGDELDLQTRDFIRRSGRRARVAQTLTAAAALIFGVIAVAAVYAELQASRERETAVSNAAEARAEKLRADQNAAAAERETEQATHQAARSDARTELVQAELIVKNSPRESLNGAYNAAQKLESLDAGADAIPAMTAVLNSARESPPKRPYSHYNLGGGTVFASQAVDHEMAQTNVLVNDRPTTRPFAVIGSLDVTAVVDDQGRSVSLPIGGGEIDGSYANDAAWLDNDHFLLATGTMQRMIGGEDKSPFNSAVWLYGVDGKVVEKWLADSQAPVTSVAVIDNNSGKSIIAGDGVGNLFVRSAKGTTTTIATKVAAPIRRIIANESEPLNLLLIFGRPVSDSNADVSAPQSEINAEDLKSKLSEALGFPVALSYLGNKPSDDIGCAIAVEFQIFVCDRNSVSIWNFFEPLTSAPQRSFSAHSASVTAIAKSPVSPVIATASADGQIRLWLTSGTMLADLSTNDGQGIGALGFINNGRTLLSSSAYGLQAWDISDVADQYSDHQYFANDIVGQAIEQAKWIGDTEIVSYDSERLKSVLNDETGRDPKLYVTGKFLLEVKLPELRIINMEDLSLKTVSIQHDTAADFGEQFAFSRGAGDVMCVLYEDEIRGTGDISYKRQLYAIDAAAGTILSSWPIPEELSKEVLLPIAAHTIGKKTTCWVGGGQTLAMYSPEDGASRQFKVLSQQARLEQLKTLDETNTFFIAASEETGNDARTVVMRAYASSSNNASAGVANTVVPDLAVAEISVGKSTKLRGGVNMMAVNDDGRRIAIALLGGNHNSGVPAVWLFDQNLNVVMTLPGIPDMFTDLAFNHETTLLRGSAGQRTRYQQDLRLRSLLDRAKVRSSAWSDDDDRGEAYDSAVAEKDPEKAKAILLSAVARHPSDPPLTLLLANREFYTARTNDDKSHALQAYDRTNLLDPFEPISHYMRGKARALTGNFSGAAADFGDAIALPHILPQVKVIAGFLELNSGIAKLSYQLNLQSKAELYVRRAVARLAVGGWRSAIEDVGWLRANNQLSVLAYESEGDANYNLGNAPAAITSYQQAAQMLPTANFFGLVEFNYNMKETAWRDFKLAYYNKIIGDLYTKMGRTTDANAAYAAEKVFVANANSSSDLSDLTRIRLKELSDDSPQQRCIRQPEFKSADSSQAIQVAFSNQTASPIKLYWINYLGQRQSFANVRQGENYIVASFLTHPWLVTDSSDRCLAIYFPGEQPNPIVVH